MTDAIVRPMRAGEQAACERILRSLPDWFGIEESLRRYAADVDRWETFVAELSGEVVAFLTVRPHSPTSAEVHVVAVRAEHHRRGLGRALLVHAEDLLRRRHVEYLQVKTLGPSRANEAYERTRRFYEGMGFSWLEEDERWGPANPCLQMVKHLACGRPAGSVESGR